jgi:hypothetical protein
VAGSPVPTHTRTIAVHVIDIQLHAVNGGLQQHNLLLLLVQSRLANRDLCLQMRNTVQLLLLLLFFLRIPCNFDPCQLRRLSQLVYCRVTVADCMAVVLTLSALRDVLVLKLAVRRLGRVELLGELGDLGLECADIKVAIALVHCQYSRAYTLGRGTKNTPVATAAHASRVSLRLVRHGSPGG